jgi:hypothetical protein
VIGDWLAGDWLIGDWLIGDWLIGDWVANLNSNTRFEANQSLITN